jgi:hypothetical protein
MNYQRIQQQSKEWWELKVGKVSGTRFGLLISGRENTLVDELANEVLDGQCDFDDFTNEDMLFGQENEPIALQIYSQRSGIALEHGGVILSDFSPIHMASPDAVNCERGIVVEVKCTMHGKTQLNRFRKGIDSNHLGQVINYFAVSDSVNEVHWLSYCPYRPERDLIVIVFKRDTVISSKETKARGLEVVTIQDVVIQGRTALVGLEKEVNDLVREFKTIQF